MEISRNILIYEVYGLKKWGQVFPPSVHQSRRAKYTQNKTLQKHDAGNISDTQAQYVYAAINLCMKSMLTLQLKMVNKIAQEKNVRVRLGLY
jgi:hypothetical protein